MAGGGDGGEEGRDIMEIAHTHGGVQPSRSGTGLGSEAPMRLLHVSSPLCPFTPLACARPSFLGVAESPRRYASVICLRL